jgi:hypothetical protein
MIFGLLVDADSFLRRHLRYFEVQNQAVQARYVLSALESAITDGVG